jgi:hypothetical protein
MRPFTTVFFEAVQRLLLEEPAVAAIVGGRVLVNERDPVEEENIACISIYEDREAPEPSDLDRGPDMRRLTFQVDMLDSRREGKELAESLAVLGDAVEAVLLRDTGNLDRYDAALAAEGRSDRLLEIGWDGMEAGYIDDGGRLIGARTIQLYLIYEKVPEIPELPDFLEAGTHWGVPGDGDEVLSADNVARPNVEDE